MKTMLGSVFGKYDVRGKYPSEINEDLAYAVGRSFCEYLDINKIYGDVVVGRDARTSSPSLAESFIKGVTDSGRDAVFVGDVTTPLFYFSVFTEKSAGGAMITASHNPAEYNGIKLVKEDAVSLVSGELGLIKSLVERGMGPAKIGLGKVREESFLNRYAEYLLSEADTKSPIMVVADASGGASGGVLGTLLESLENVKSANLFFGPDGTFKKHEPDPLKKEAQKFASEKIRKIGADFGFIFDADGDRVIFIDEKGEMSSPDMVYSVFLDGFIKKGDLIFADTRMSKSVLELASIKGASSERVRAGHANVKRTMREAGARFAGELSGHYYFREFHYSDSSSLMLLRVMSLFSKQNKPFSEWVGGYRKYFHSGEMNFNVENREKAFQDLKKIYSGRLPDGSQGRQSFIDGLTVEYPSTGSGQGGWWFNARLSNTEPVLRLVVEADTKELLEEKVRELSQKLNG